MTDKTEDGGPAKKTLDPNTYLQAVALFAMACHHADQSTTFAEALATLLGYEDGGYYMGHISDYIYAGTSGKRPSLDILLKREGFEVMDLAAMLTARKEGQGGAS